MAIDPNSKINKGNLNGALNSALYSTNVKLIEEKSAYVVDAIQFQELEVTKPVFLFVRSKSNSKDTKNIGIVYFAHLTKDFEKVPFEETARTIEELADAIFRAVKIYEDKKDNRDIVFTKKGIPFCFNRLNIKVVKESLPGKEKTVSYLFVENKKVFYKGKALATAKIIGEGILDFVKKENGDFQIVDSNDEREGKGLYINKDTAEIYIK